MSLSTRCWSRRVAIAAMRARLLIVVVATTIASHGFAQSSAAAIDVEDCAVRFAEEIRIPAVEAGRVVEVRVQVNDIVTATQMLARQDDSAALLRRRAAVWQQTAAREATSDEVDLDYAKALYAEAVAQRDADSSIYQKGGGSLRTLRQSELGVERARLEIARAEKALRLAQIQYELRSAELTAIDDQLNRLKIASPIAGVILSLDRRAGEWIKEGETIATVARMDQLRIDAFLSVQQLPPQQAAGLQVSVVWQNGDQRHQLRGVIDSVDPQILTGQRYRLHATIENKRSGNAWVLVPGMEVAMQVHPERKDREN
ncbi:p-hydroxybenzoic acid efflux subunit AaeA [Rosistilla carotiformis]|uniref:p-hydroxybenzoic acid efflux subunit AaeA n=1 Tax=Rosistilla carotiformis TaxID=2528017 RepID=A0A518JXK7_9BACT|nr:HlyD family efflux transporter periplasmic adaptor subunit [Rosistilla carotiformis]QDV70268.1 p-hydroxybenzoic acid efflux subunit AaeA [Rosistilla carotiformis]